MMSDERRYWFVIDKGKLEYVQDNVTNEKITVSELEDLLNELSDENGQLKEENEQLRKELNKYKIVILQFVGLLAENGIMESSVKE